MAPTALVHDDATVVLPIPVAAEVASGTAAGTAGPSMPAPAPSPGRGTGGLKIAAALLVVLALLLGGAVGVLASRSGKGTVTTTGPVATTPGADLGDATSAIPGTPVTTAVPASTAPATTAAPTTTAPPAPTTTQPPVTQPPAPVPPVVTVAAPAKVNCTGGGTPYLNVSWNAPGSTGVDLAIDGPGLYKHYDGAAGSDSVPFACDGPHTYTFTAHGPGGDGSRVVVIESYHVLSPPMTIDVPIVSIPLP